ncbi:hypothetical protein [Pedococcus sp. 5OH_020]|uniref:hypothetical protein n=1 Tax=Pedococcus sp. 5OH_020 TaxID=2989814 RepID=UPI0022EA06B2|nr:hypothetical protein [Pedococcus sp. 5OH_020]
MTGHRSHQREPRVLELRIHGVSNTPPHAMLDLPESDVMRADGDDGGSFWVRRPEVPNPAKTSRGHTPAGVHREAYSWGSLARSTFRAGSGVAATVVDVIVRTLWTLLLPFALTNVAYWSRRLHDGAPPSFSALSKGHAGGAWIMRLNGLVQTLMVAVTAVVLSVDLVGVQCQPTGSEKATRCTGIPSAFGFLDSWTMGARMTLTSIIPIVLVVALYALSARTRTRFELATRNQDPAKPAARLVRAFPDSATGTPRWPILSTPGFWNHSRVTAPSATTHLAATVAMVVGLCSSHLWTDGSSTHDGGWKSAGLVWPALTCLSALVLAWTFVLQARLDPLAADVACDDAPPDAVAEHRRSSAWRTLGLAVALYAVFVVAAPREERSASAPSGPMTGVHGAVTTLAVLTVLLAVVALGARSRQTGDGSGLASTVLQGLLGLPLAVAFAVLPTWPVASWPVWDWSGWQTISHRGIGRWVTGDQRATAIAIVVAAGMGLTAWAYWRSGADTKAPDPTATDVAGSLSERARTGWGGRAPGVFIALGAFFGFVVLSALTLFVGDRLNGDHSAGSLVGPRMPAPAGSAPQLLVPGLYGWFALAAVGGLGLMLLSVVVAHLGWWRKATGEVVPGVAEGSPTERAVWRSRSFARLAHRAEPLLALLLACVISASVAVVAARQVAGAPEWPIWSTAVTAASLILAAAVVGVVAAGGTTSSRSAVRPLGILWDLACAVPRAAHPLGPPCYGERVVPEVLERCRRWLDGGRDAHTDEDTDEDTDHDTDHDTTITEGSRAGLSRSTRSVVLSAHSLGGVIAVSAILGAPRPEYQPGDANRLPAPCERGDWLVPRLALITYGTQLRAYFGRFFPELFGPAVLGVRPVRRARLLAADPWSADWLQPRTTFTPPSVLAWSLRQVLSLHPRDASNPEGVPGRWYSLWRLTDYLGFPAVARPERVLDKPDSEDWRALHDRYASEVDFTAYLLTTLTHSDYPRTEEYSLALTEAVTDLSTLGHADGQDGAARHDGRVADSEPPILE